MALRVRTSGVVTGLVPSTVASAATSTFTPVADSSPVRRNLLKFTVSGVTTPVVSAKLRLHVNDISDGGSPSGGTLERVTSTSWSESAETWNNQPAIDGPRSARSGRWLATRGTRST